MTFESAIDLIKQEYEKASESNYINNPLAYALYQVWEKADREIVAEKKETCGSCEWAMLIKGTIEKNNSKVLFLATKEERRCGVMLENVVIDCSPLTNTLRIGRVGKERTHLLEWEEREDEILCAVRDFLYQKAVKNNAETFGYEWTRKDGKIVELRVTVKGGEE